MKLVTKYYSWIDKLISKNVDSTGLSLFRIFYCVILCFEIGQIIYFRHLIYDKIPFIIPSEINVLPGLLVWLISVIFVLFGFYTRKAALVNYVLSLVFIGTIKSYEYHVFYTYMGVNFLFLFLDISKNHSIDRLRKKLKYSTARFSYDPDRKVGVWNYFILIAVGVGFVYFDSIFFKLASYNWMNGLGMWLPASLPMTTHVDASPILNIKWLAIGMGYLTVVFEFIFLFTFYLKRFRIPLLIIGVGLHLGIIIIFPIPWFGLSVLAIYLLMIPHRCWKWLGKKIKQSNNLTVFYDQNCPLCNRTRISFQHIDYLAKIEWKSITSTDAIDLSIPKEKMYESMHAVSSNDKIYKGLNTYLQITKRIPLLYPFFLVLSIPGIYHIANYIYNAVASNRAKTHCTDDTCGYIPPEIPKHSKEIKILENVSLHQMKVFLWGSLFLVLIFFQINVTAHSKLVGDALEISGIRGTKMQRSLANYSKKVWGISKIFLGITRHGVFMDGHFDDYNHIIGVEAELPDGRKEWLPIINEDGTAGLYDYSFNWVKWTFRVVDNEVRDESLRKGIRDFATFWAITNGYDATNVHYNIYAKPLDIPKVWERDFLRNQKKREWVKIGKAFWRGDRFITTYPKIETIVFDE